MTRTQLTPNSLETEARLSTDLSPQSSPESGHTMGQIHHHLSEVLLMPATLSTDTAMETQED